MRRCLFWSRTTPTPTEPPPPNPSIFDVGYEVPDNRSKGLRCDVVGTGAGDVLRSTADSQIICGGGGSDRIEVTHDFVKVAGGSGNDSITTTGADWSNLYPGPGDDRVTIRSAYRAVVYDGSLNTYVPQLGNWPAGWRYPDAGEGNDTIVAEDSWDIEIQSGPG